MNSDLPLNKRADDKLGRFSFATEVASGLVNSFSDNNESIVIGINGNWGSGKSTIINFIINEVERISVENGNEIIVIRFNPWMFTGQKELQNIFLKEMLLKLESNKEKFKGISQKIADFLSHLNWLKYIHQGAGEAVADAKEFLDGISKSKDVEQLKKDIDQILINSKVKLYITIDDIDRLTPSEITDIFQLVKLNGNFANTIFLLAYDQGVVLSALKRQFGDNGKKYIEKIVQIDYTLPPISRQNITRIFIDSFNDLFPQGELRDLIYNLTETIKDKPFMRYFKSLRDIYRFNNSIKLRLPSIYSELNLTDFLLVEALRIFDYESYEFIIENKDSLVFRDSETIYAASPTPKTSTKDFINQTQFNNTTKEIINNLFSTGIMSFFDSIDSKALIRDRRAANPNYFDRYFNLQLSSLDIPEQVFDKFINESDLTEQTDILKKITSEKKLFDFLNWLEIKSLNQETAKIENMILACLGFTDSLKYEKESFWGLDINFMTLIRFASKMLDHEKIDKRRDILLKHISNTNKDYSFSAFFIADNLLYSKSQFDQDKLSHNNLWFNILNDGLIPIDKIIENEFFDQVKRHHGNAAKFLFDKVLKDPEYLNDDELTSILSVVKYNHSDYYDANFPSLIKDNKNLIRFIHMVMKRNSMSSGDQIGYQVAKYQFFAGMDLENIKARIENFNLAEYTDDEKIIIKMFLKAYKDGFLEKKYYSTTNLESMEY
ncbi:P-loop NTPase fold protein [Flavobacterium sp.]|uniref:KAP family P-loop NTPase fold protein n=1 Tax=Flavobacterium sp. TaxID=239 RepID=UPI0039E26A30